MSLPAAAVLARLGPRALLQTGLGIICSGCLLIQLVRWAPGFEIVFAGLFLIATGVVGLQVAANPLAARLGDARHSHFRLALAHALNSIGTVCGGLFGAHLILGTSAFENGGGPSIVERVAGSQAIASAYALIALLAAALLVVVMLGLRERSVHTGRDTPASAGLAPVLRSRWALAGAFGISAYVGAEVTIGSLLIPYLAERDGMSLARAGTHVATLYWGSAFVGRIAGSWLLRTQPAGRLLAVAAAVALLLCAGGVALPGIAAPWCLLAIGLFNSIMFPTIFSLTLERSQAGAAAISGFLCFAIGAGAIVPFLAGLFADSVGLTAAFWAPLICYLYILGFAGRCGRKSP
jgi:MFS transporter, FHS family, L-fucose permease